MIFSLQELVTIDTGNHFRPGWHDQFANSVALSGNGQRMAVGAYDGEINAYGDVGYVRLYDKDGTEWNMIQQINGTADRGYFGGSVDLSHDGSTLTVGSLYNDVRMYEFSNSSFSYALLYTTDRIFAAEVSVSGDGKIVGVTSTTSSSGARIFERIGDEFQQKGSAFTDYGRYRSGIALNYFGTIVIIGDRNWSSGRGRVGVFQWKDDGSNGSMEWMQMGSDIKGDTAYTNFGFFGCVSTTHDGLTVAIGAETYDKDGLADRGLVRVYNYASTEDMWKKSPDLLGDNSYDRLSKTALSYDGTYLVVGAYGGEYVKILEKNGSNYEVIGDKVISGEGGNFGFSVDMSADGDSFAIGAYRYDGYKGRAYLFVGVDLLTHAPSLSPSPSLSPTTTQSPTFTKAPSFVPTRNPSSEPSTSQTPSLVPTKEPSSIPSTTHTPSLVPTKNPSSIPSTSPSFPPTAIASKTEFALTFLGDDTIIDFEGTSPDNEIIIKTLISNKAPRESFDQTILVGTDCQSKLVDEYPEDTTLISIGNDESLDVVEGKNIKVTSEVNIDTATIVSKGTHASDPDNKSISFEYEEDGEEMAKIEFCIRTDYGKVDVTTSDGSIIESSVNFYTVKVVITFLLQIGFTSVDVSIAEAEESKVGQAGTITAVLNACDCPAAAASKEDCFDTPVEYDQNDILSVCVYDPTDNAFVTSFKGVTLSNGQISAQVIDSDGKPTSLASMNILNEGMAMVNTRIVSVFFDDSDGVSPATVTISGSAVIGFSTTGTRKLATVGMRGGKNMRKLQDNSEAAVGGESTFDVEVVLSNSEGVDGSPSPDALGYLTTPLVWLIIVPICLF